MINNKQVNIWRGTDPPPTKYHIWFKDETYLLKYDEALQDWIIFLDSKGIDNKISEVLELLYQLSDFTVNGKDIKTNPVLEAQDLTINYSGNYIHSNDTIEQSIITFDKLLTTKIYDGQ